MTSSKKPLGELPTSRPERSAPAEAFCLRCQASLDPYGDRCRRCGLEFDPRRPETYRRRPEFLRWRFWFPGFALAVASGVLSYAVVMTSGEMGAALFVCVPVSVGVILGYATRAGVWIALLLALIAVPGIALALVSMNFAGFFCGVTLSIIFLGPALLGVVLGLLLRVLLRSSRWDQRGFLPIVFVLLFPYGASWVEGRFPRERVVASVETELTVDATPEEAWQALAFYEEVEHEPPWLLKLALPKPRGSSGPKQRVGDRVRCVYDRGHLNKQITEVVPGRRLAFVVTEQNLHIERDVRLVGGDFELAPDGEGRTRLKVTTRYEKLLRPQWIWTPFERKVIHTLHGHVLEGVKRKAEGEKSYRPKKRPAPPVAANGVGGSWPLVTEDLLNVVHFDPTICVIYSNHRWWERTCSLLPLHSEEHHNPMVFAQASPR